MDIKEIRKNMDINVTLALVKCLTEQLAGMQWDYSHQVKQKFNRFLKVARVYEKEIDKSMELSNDDNIENIYDAFMESIVEAKEIAINNIIKENKLLSLQNEKS
tara:strand:+ start:2026 stop:2337 length:312 start_codon:yes stop_codon:yes gene_type:complete